MGWSNKVYAYSVHMFAVFARDEGTAPAIIVPGQEVTYVSAQQSWIKDLYTFGGKSALIQPAGAQAQTPEEETYLGMYNDDAKRAKNPGAALALALKERGLAKARLALDQERVMPNVRAQIEAALPDAEIVDAADFFRLIRMVKTPDELAALLRRRRGEREGGNRRIERGGRGGDRARGGVGLRGGGGAHGRQMAVVPLLLGPPGRRASSRPRTRR